jgi:hypothetical protein
MSVSGSGWHALAAVVLVHAFGLVSRAEAARPGEPRIVARHVVPAVELPGGSVRVGGLSDLFVTESDGGAIVAWTLTDRGPNGLAGKGDAKRRTLLSPEFAPSLLRLRFASAAANPPSIEAVLPLAGRSGKPLSGRPNGVGHDEEILDASSGRPVPPDPDGVDPEGLVVMSDGSFWVSEEYRPSLLRVSAAGRAVERHVPAGVRLPGADVRVIDDFPAVYGQRRDNRGFEGLAASADGRRLYLLLQSPLDHPGKAAAKRTGNVRVLVADAATGRPVAEHVYRLGDPADPAWATAGAAPEDGKLCGIAALDDGGLVVLEQADGGVARLYRVDPAAATDTLPRTLAAQAAGAAAASDPLEVIGDLEAAGITPLPKRCVADFAPLLPQIRTDVGLAAGAPVKLEGLAVLGGSRLLLVNDNDFGVTADPAGPAPRSCLWEVSLPAGMTAEHAPAAVVLDP